MDLSDFFTTRSQASDFAAHLNTIIDKVFTTNFDLEKTLTQELGIRKKDAFIKLLRDNKIVSSSTGDVQNFLKKIQETVIALSVVSLTIAFEPTEETLKVFSQWFLSSLNKQVLFDIHVDTNLIAGATITYNGKFKDYSIRPIFENFIRHVTAGSTTPTPTQTTATAPIHQTAEEMSIGR
jgi:F0F1-type ATP synthase delta subunit